MTPVDPLVGGAGTVAGRTTSPAFQVAKRLVDLTLATVALLAALPLMAAAAVAVRATGRPVLFRQTRIGRGGRQFTLLKLRTMHAGTDDDIHRTYVTHLLDGAAPQQQDGMYKLSRDPRVTRVGAFLRRTSIDELPQLLNVLRGEMSLVGPRPALPYEVELYDERQRTRLDVKPGITGLWQISGRSELTMREALELDVVYAQEQSMLLDLRILIRTVPVVLSMRGAR